jgi:hypothetical protein
MKKNRVAGKSTRLGRLLCQRPNFVSDGFFLEEMTPEDIIVSCIASEEITDWGATYIDTVSKISLFRKNYNQHKNVVLLVSSSKTDQNKIIHTVLDETSKAYDWKIINVPPFEDSEAEYIADQIEDRISTYPFFSRVSACKRKSFIAKLLGV